MCLEWSRCSVNTDTINPHNPAHYRPVWASYSSALRRFTLPKVAPVVNFCLLYVLWHLYLQTSLYQCLFTYTEPVTALLFTRKSLQLKCKHHRGKSLHFCIFLSDEYIFHSSLKIKYHPGCCVWSGRGYKAQEWMRGTLWAATIICKIVQAIEEAAVGHTGSRGEEKQVSSRYIDGTDLRISWM